MNSTDNDSQYYDDDYYYFGPGEVSSFVITRIASGISILSALCILLETRRFRVCLHQILFSLSCALIISGIASIFGTTPLSDHDFYGARGTTATCSLQGFFLQLGGTLAVMWDVALSIIFLFIVKYNWTERRLSTSLMRVFHGVIWPVAIALCVAPLFFELYNPYYDLCWIAAYPSQCGYDDDYECERGSPLVEQVFHILNTAILILAIAVSIGSMLTLFWHVRELENRNHRYSFGASTTDSGQQSTTNHTNLGRESTSTSGPDRRRSQAVALQGMLYSSTIVLANVPTFIANYYSPTWFLVVTAASRNLYGLYYLLIFMRKKSSFETRYGRLIHWIFQRCCCCCCFGGDGDGRHSRSSRPTSKTQQAASTRNGIQEEPAASMRDANDTHGTMEDQPVAIGTVHETTVQRETTRNIDNNRQESAASFFCPSDDENASLEAGLSTLHSAEVTS
ncbi:expressed unknown protein [Seminavis robusta]|uniref:G-protein coupled receptors family 2 profile 2 domain-containing protein n=1 Tax=Seminavis robusta TaxID=568900 RepID=A0A9N8E704_9STRA|nr:expressed unknown protein [Seminavis robusta]|eukprot:Sro690_g187650.1 n/a (452) ;mRNA; r:31196-32551